MSRILIGKTIGLNDIYPIGSRYIQFPNMPTPAELFNNTSWEIDTEMQGRTIIGSGGSYVFGSVGGENTHTLTINEMPRHDHYVRHTSESNGVAPSEGPGSVIDSMGVWAKYIDSSAETTKTGNSQPHNIMQPYIVVNFWKRTD